MDFEIITNTNSGRYTFLTKAKNGKGALLNLIEHSSDFKNILGEKESNRMSITIAPC